MSEPHTPAPSRVGATVGLVLLALNLRGPLVAVGREPDAAPWHGLSYAPLHAVAARYAAAGAKIWNIPEVDTVPMPANRRIAP